MAHRSTRLSRRTAAAVGLLTACGLLAGCASTAYADDTVTIGYFANVTHAPALIAEERVARHKPQQFVVACITERVEHIA